MTIRKTQQLANSLNLLAQLPEGDSLVQLLGTGNETTNLDAIEHWINEQKDLLEIEDPEFLVQQIMVRLRSKLENLNSFLND